MNKLILLSFVFVLFVTKEVPAQFTVTPSQTNPTCLPGTGAASVTASGGSNYTYKWNTGATTSSISDLNAGNYTVTVYSSGGAAGYIMDTIYKETFDEANPQWAVNIPTGNNEASNNYWTINDSASGGPIGTCLTYLEGDNTLYVTSYSYQTALGQELGAQPGASFDNGGTCAYASYGYGFCTATNMAAQSANIPTSNTAHPSGPHNLIVSYDFVGNGGESSDYASSLYSLNGGTTFVSLDPLLRSSQLCTVTGPNDFRYPDGGGIWERRSYPMPSDAYGITDFVIRFNWTNIDDGTGADPSVAINNVWLLDSIPTGGSTVDSIVKTINLPADSATPPTITGNPLKICASDSSQLCVTSGSYVHYTWNTVLADDEPGDTTSCIYVYAAGDYYVSVTDINGCAATSSQLGITTYPVATVSITEEGDTLASYGQVGYQWFKNGSPINGATSQVYVASSPGSYQVQVTDTNGCKTLSQPVNTAVQNLGNDVGFEIYPNPASTGSIQLSISTDCMGCDIEMYDAIGQIVYQGKVTSQKQEIDISKLAKGIYTVKVSGGVREFVKQ